MKKHSHPNVQIWDLDGCLADFNSRFRALLIEQTGIEIPEVSGTFPDRWDWVSGLPLTSKQKNTAWDTVRETDFWETLDPLPECAAALAQIRQARSDGSHVYFATARPGTYAKFLTECWLDNQGFECPSVIICSGERKGALCRALEATTFVDDRADNCNGVVAHSPDTEVFILDKPYNRGAYVFEAVTRITSILDPRILGVAVGV